MEVYLVAKYWLNRVENFVRLSHRWARGFIFFFSQIKRCGFSWQGWYFWRASKRSFEVSLKLNGYRRNFAKKNCTLVDLYLKFTVSSVRLKEFFQHCFP